jgi:hypothetical protein
MLSKFQEIELLLDRADEHLEWLRKYVSHPDPNLRPENSGYYILPESGDLFAGKMRILMGEFASCLRNALNYATCTLAEQDSGRLGRRVQFPIEDSSDGFMGRRNSYLKGVRDEHLALFEKLQPYNAGNEFKLLREFTNDYRHRELIRVEKVFQRPGRFVCPPKIERHPTFTVEVREFTFAVSLPDGSAFVETLEDIKRRVVAAIKEFKPLLDNL